MYLHTDGRTASRPSTLSYLYPQAVRAVLGALPYANNAVYLHTDAALMQRRCATWASWKCIQALNPEVS